MPAARDLPRVSADTRVAASVTLLAVVVCASAAFALTPRAGAVSASANRLAQASPPPVVKIVNATPRSERCEEQTWPYFDRRCLPSAAQSPPAASMPSSATTITAPPSAAAQSAQPAKPSASPATARQVTGGSQAASASALPTDVATRSAAVTTAIAPRDEGALSPARRAEREDIQRRDELIAAWEAEEAARYAEEDRPPEPRRRKVRRHYPHFGIFGFGLRF